MVMIRTRPDQRADLQQLQGSLFVIEGPQGAGKTTIAEAVYQHLLQQHGTDQVVLTREPRGVLGDVLNSTLHDLTPTAKFFALLAARADHVQTHVKPALQRSAIVICDRFTPSTLVYNIPQVLVEQSELHGQYDLLTHSQLVAAEYMARQGITPVINFLVSTSDMELIRRVGQRPAYRAMRYGSRTNDEIREVNLAYHQLVHHSEDRWATVNGTAPVAESVEFIASLINIEVAGH